MILSLPRVIRLVFLAVFSLRSTLAWAPSNSLRRPVQLKSSTSAVDSSGIEGQKPVLVVGATGRVGRLVVQELMGKDIPVRALVRDREKARSVFGTSTSLEYPKLDVIEADLSLYDENEEVLDKAVDGCDSIISVMGVVRFANFFDFLPWRIFRQDVSGWAGRNHPYFGDYLGNKFLIQLAGKHNAKRFVRLTGLGIAYPVYNPFSLLFNTLLSLNNRWHILVERALAKSKVPYVVLRPGGLSDKVRDKQTTNLQVDPSGKLPFPGRCGRRDVASLAVACLSIPAEKSYTLACRWCGDGVKPKPQGKKEDGFATARECIDNLMKSFAIESPPPKMKPYGLAVATFVYGLGALGFLTARSLWHLALRLFWGQ